MSSAKHEFEGKDVADAIRKACKSLNAAQEDLHIEVLNTGSTGIFGLCRQKARLRVSRKKEEPASTTAAAAVEIETDADSPAGPAAPTPAREKKHSRNRRRPKQVRPPAPVRAESPADDSEESPPAPENLVLGPDIVEKIRADLAELLTLMHCPSTLAVSHEKNMVSAKIDGDHLADIIGPEGKTLDSLQYLFRKIISKKFSEKIVFSIDAGSYRADRLAELESLAVKLAAEVKKTGKTKAIPSLNPSERRAIHLSLQEDKDIRSRSVGEGLYKKMLIYRPGKTKRNTRKKSADGDMEKFLPDEN